MLNDSTIVWYLLTFGMWVVLPVVIISGWLRWWRSRAQADAFSRVSSTGFALTTLCWVTWISLLLYVRRSGGVSIATQWNVEFYRGMGLLALCGFALGIIGACRPNQLRWYTPAASLGMLLYSSVAILTGYGR